MGIDVNLYAEGEVTDEELSAANLFMKNRCDIADDWQTTGNVLNRDDEEWFTAPRVALSTMARFYGQGYERGPWPNIYGAIRLLQAALPKCKVFYGGDSTDDGEECTEEFLAEMWAHFLGPNGDDYRERHRRESRPAS